MKHRGSHAVKFVAILLAINCSASVGFADAIPALPGADMKPGDRWQNPMTGKKMILVPTRVVRQDTGLLGGSAWVKWQWNAEHTAVIGNRRPWIDHFAPAGWFVTGFLMDEKEVSNADYLSYMKAIGAAAPSSWAGQTPTGPTLGESVQVSQKEAEKYAEWAGGSLPLYVEFNSALAGSDGVYPWSRCILKQPSNSWSAISSEMDVTPLGIRQLMTGKEWENGQWPMVGPQGRIGDGEMAFALADESRMPHLELSIGLPGVVSNASFRTVVRHVAIPFMSKHLLVGRSQIEMPKDLPTVNLTIKNASDSEAKVLVSNLDTLSVKQAGETTISLPTGAYLFTFDYGKTFSDRYWTVMLSAPTPGTPGAAVTLVVTNGFGVPFPPEKK